MGSQRDFDVMVPGSGIRIAKELVHPSGILSIFFGEQIERQMFGHDREKTQTQAQRLSFLSNDCQTNPPTRSDFGRQIISSRSE
jgi:hypothetical protein